MIIELLATASVTAAVTSALWMGRESRLANGHEVERLAFLERLEKWEEAFAEESQAVSTLENVISGCLDELKALRPDAEKWRAKKERDRAYDARRRAKAKPLNWDQPIWDALGRGCDVSAGLSDDHGDRLVNIKGHDFYLWFTPAGKIEGEFDNSDFDDVFPRAPLTNTPPLEKSHEH